MPRTRVHDESRWLGVHSARASLLLDVLVAVYGLTVLGTLVLVLALV